ncbi:MAG TPA: site-specific integrase [Firmicutes bacterium]|jgi:integrase|nr:site-specific integrase [Candidatus Fermentithermobacillaceae bacterium]
MAAKRRGRGEGTIHQRKDGLWVAQISLGYDAEGKRIRETVYGKTKAEVKEKLLKLQQDALKGQPVKPEKVTVAQHFEDWLRAKKPSVRAATYASYEGLYNNHVKPAFGHLRLKDLDYRRINALFESLDEKDLSARTVAYVGYLLRTVLEDAVRKGLIPANPAKLAVRRTYKTDEARYLNQEELKRFLNAAKGERLEDAFILALHTGLRPGEWLGLPWDAIDWKSSKLTVKQALKEVNGEVSIGEVKTKAGMRTISLSKEALAALRRRRKRQIEEKLACGPSWHNEHNLVFTNLQGGLLRRTNVSERDFKRVCDRAGIEGASLHTLRHTHASILIYQGADIKVISRRLGHENITITLQTYGHLLPGQDEGAADRMDAFIESLSRMATVRQ